MMTNKIVSVDDLLAGAQVTYDIEVPADVLRPGSHDGEISSYTVRVKPLTIGVFQLIIKAAKNDSGLIPLLMVKEALVEPAMGLEQVKSLHMGLITFLIGHIREISGLTEKKNC